MPTALQRGQVPWTYPTCSTSWRLPRNTYLPITPSVRSSTYSSTRITTERPKPAWINQRPRPSTVDTVLGVRRYALSRMQTWLKGTRPHSGRGVPSCAPTGVSNGGFGKAGTVGDDEAARDSGRVLDPGKDHVGDELLAEQVECPDHAILATCGERVEHWSSGHHGSSAERERLEYVGAASDAAVEQDLSALPDRRCDRRQRIQRRYRAVELPPAVVGDDDRLGAVLDGEQRVLRRENAFDDDRQ